LNAGAVSFEYSIVSGFILILNLNLQRESFRLSRHSAFLCIAGGVGVAPTENIILHLHRYRLSHPQLSPSKKGERNLT